MLLKYYTDVQQTCLWVTGFRKTSYDILTIVLGGGWMSGEANQEGSLHLLCLKVFVMAHLP